MKKVIKGKLYNTETATLVGEYSNGLGCGDFRNLNEDLYVTRSRKFFLHGVGGAMTRWSESNGNTTWGSSGIEVLSESEALEWCENHNIDPDIIAKFFTIEEA